MLLPGPIGTIDIDYPGALDVDTNDELEIASNILINNHSSSLWHVSWGKKLNNPPPYKGLIIGKKFRLFR